MNAEYDGDGGGDGERDVHDRPLATAKLTLRATMPTWSAGGGAAAVCEVIPRLSRGTRQSVSLGIGSAETLDLAPGDYTARLFLPNGEVLAESVSLRDRHDQEVTFDLAPSPHDWLGAASLLGTIDRLPTTQRAEDLDTFSRASDEIVAKIGLQGFDQKETRLSFTETTAQQGLLQARNVRALAELATTETRERADAVERISGRQLVQQISASRRITAIAPRAEVADASLPWTDVVRWWTGSDVAPRQAMQIADHDGYNAKLVTAPSNIAQAGDALRAFAEVVDPWGNRFLAVLPEGWKFVPAGAPRSSEVLASTSVLMTVVTVANASPNDKAYWRCSPSVDDLRGMSALAFLASGQTEAANVLLKQAEEQLFDKTINPAAAAVGAYLLLTYSEEANSEARPEWRSWVRNLYMHFPFLPDGAIAMASMYLRHGHGSKGEELEIDQLRRYALEAVRRGLPYFSFGVSALAEILRTLVRDDEASSRGGSPVEETKRAYSLVHRLTRTMQPGELFTVLSLGSEPP
jgi:hypothetical protein